MPSRDLIERVRKALGDRYTVITAVGRGGNASIFGAYDQAGQRVAIKVLHPELAVSVAADRFLREIRYASQLNHPHIARLLDSGETDYLLWFAMPYLPRGDPAPGAAPRAAAPGRPSVPRRLRGARSTPARPSTRHRAPRHQARQHRAVPRGRDTGRPRHRARDRDLG